jgi:subtilase family serine protease
MRHPLLRRTVLALGAGALVIPVAASAAQAAPVQRAEVSGTAPTWAKPSNEAGAPASTDRMDIQVSLNLRDAAGAERLAAAVSDPNSGQYGRYLTPAQFNARYAPSADSVKSVESYLRGQGLTVTGVAEGNRWVSASGTVSQVDSAFGTTVKTYRYDGKRLNAPSKAASVPSNVAPLVQSVGGLTELAPLRHPFSTRIASDGAQPNAAAPSATKPAPAQCSAFWGQHSQTLPAAYGRTEFPTYGCGYTPDQLQSAYGVKPLLAKGQNGSGVTVAIVDAYGSPTMEADTNTFSQANGLPAFKSGQYKEKLFQPYNLQDECGGEDGWNGEEAIDVEAAHSVAPGAKIQYVGAQNCDTGLDTALNWIIQHHSADLISDSWGNLGEDIPAAEIATEHSIFVQAAAEGIGFYFSSGDSGDEVTAGNTPSAQPDYPASDPYVTAVGGTSLAVGIDNGYQFETGWGNGVDRVDYTGTDAQYTQALPGYFYAGAGGGVSTLFDQPSYQRRVVPASLAREYGDRPARVVPDVAALADPYTGFAVGRTIAGTYTVQTWGGTSLACPLFAGVQAVASTGRHTAIGFANPLLYSLAGSAAYHDVVPQRVPVALATPSGSALITEDRDSSLATSYGYDDVTGVGSPNGKAFVAAEARRR